MSHSHHRHYSIRQRRNGQVLLVAVLMMIVIAVLGSTFAAVIFSAQIHPTPLIPKAENRIVA